MNRAFVKLNAFESAVLGCSKKMKFWHENLYKNKLKIANKVNNPLKGFSSKNDFCDFGYSRPHTHINKPQKTILVLFLHSNRVKYDFCLPITMLLRSEIHEEYF